MSLYILWTVDHFSLVTYVGSYLPSEHAIVLSGTVRKWTFVGS